MLPLLSCPELLPGTCLDFLLRFILIADSLNFPLLVGVDSSFSITDSYEITEAYNHTATKVYFLSRLDIDGSPFAAECYRSV
jgi:hypothetical protein